ncbi:MAG: N-acetylmuramoyl-L-alanine amidase [Alphaproteobacteria bacterium]
MTQIIERPSPNFDTRATGQDIDILLLHYTGMKTAEAALARLCDPAAKVSAHYCIDEDGTCTRLVDEQHRAWHAGVSAWAGESDINSRSIGIELVNPGHEFGYRPFPEPQMACLIALCLDILDRHSITPARVLGHSDVAPPRKQDPGELFDWARLAAAGIGLWPGTPAAAAVPPISEIQAMLRRHGYAIPQTGALDDETKAVLVAFQRHFRPRDVSGALDGETVARLQTLLDSASV